MPVTFFIDPEIVNDPDARNIREITLSYTFFPVTETADTARAPKRQEPGRFIIQGDDDPHEA